MHTSTYTSVKVEGKSVLAHSDRHKRTPTRGIDGIRDLRRVLHHHILCSHARAVVLEGVARATGYVRYSCHWLL